MAGNIKGITIEFRGETTKLDKALKDINKETSKVDKELRQVNKDLKFSPSSIELWRQKQQLLTDKIAKTSEKLKLLKQRQKELDASGVDKNSKEYRALQREIVETESKLKTFEGQLRDVGNYKLTALSQGFKEAGEKIREVGTGLTTHITVPLAAIGGAAVKTFTDVQGALNIVTTKTGATGDELENLQGIAKDIAKTMPTDFTQAATAVGELNTRFGATGDELESLSREYIKFAKVNGADLNNSIDQTQKALAAFGMSAEEAPHLLDALTRAGQLTGASTETLTAGLIQNATAFDELGLSMDQGVLLMAQLETSGANSETVMQGLRKALKNSAKEGVPLNEALEDLQSTINDSEGGMNGLAAAYDLFGKSGDQIFGAVKNGTLDFAALSAEVEDVGGTLDRTFNETLTPADDFAVALNSLKDVGYQLGSSIMTVLQPAIETLTQGIQQISAWWETLSPETQDMIVKAALIAAALGPVLVIVGTLISSIGTIIGAVSAVSGALALVSGPVLGIVAAIASVIAIGVLLYKNWDAIKEKAKEDWQSVVDTINGIKDQIVQTFTQLKANIQNAWNQIKASATAAWNSLKSAASTAWTGIKNKITEPLEKAKAKIKEIFDAIKGYFPINIGRIFSDIKLPHFSLSGKFDLKTLSVPKLSIDWYKTGGIFDSPSVIGVGEAGPEAVVPLNTLWDKLDAIAAASSGGAVVVNVYGSNNMSVNELAAAVEARLVNMTKRRREAWA